MNAEWTRKYQPFSSSEIVGQQSALVRIKNFLTQYATQKKKALLLYGPPGCGKTSSVHALVKELDGELLEINASDYRTSAIIEEKLSAFSQQQSLFGKQKIILVDEVDGISGQKDRGGIATLTKIIATSPIPVVMTANNPFDKKFSSLRKVAELVELQQLSYQDIIAVLQKVCDIENIDYDPEAIKKLAFRSQGDLRGALNDLQLLCAHNTLHIDEVDELSERNRTQRMQNALTLVFKSSEPEIVAGAFDDIEENLDLIMLWLDENIPREYLTPQDINRAFDMLSLAQVFFGRIRKWQHWRFLVYVYAFCTIGVAVAKQKKYKGAVTYTRPSRLLKMYIAKMRFQKRNAVATKLGEHIHASLHSALDSLPFLKIIQKTFPVAQELELSQDEVEWLNR